MFNHDSHEIQSRITTDYLKNVLNATSLMTTTGSDSGAISDSSLYHMTDHRDIPKYYILLEIPLTKESKMKYKVYAHIFIALLEHTKKKGRRLQSQR